MADFGPLAPLVAYAGYMTAAALAVRVAWAGKLLWEPDIRDLAKAPARVAGVISAVSIVLLFALSRSPTDWKWLIPYAIGFGGVAIVGLLGYIILLAAFTVQCTGETERTVAGLWLTPAAKQILSGNSSNLLPGQTPPGSIRELYCGSGKDPDRIWPPVAQGLAKALLVLVYIAFIAPATLSIATGALILEKAARTSSASLQDATQEWVAFSEEARKLSTVGTDAALPIKLLAARSKFETAWSSAGLPERSSVEPKLLWGALTSTIRTHRFGEYDSRQKHTSLYWSDQAIDHYDQIQNRTFLVEALLDKAAIFLELTQLDHTDAQEFQKVTRDGDKVMSRVAGLGDDAQKPTVMRIWSRFYYNLARPQSNKLSEDWNNTYLSLAVDKAEAAYKLASTDIRNATQLSRTVQKFASNVPQDADAAWTSRLRKTQALQLTAWHENQDKLKAKMERLPPLNILGVMTTELVLREWLAAGVDRKEISARLIAEMNDVALRALSEAYALVANTELRGRYSFDLTYDFARAHAVICQIYEADDQAKADGSCNEAVRLMKEAHTTATSTQLDAALQSVENHPTLARLAPARREAVRKALSSVQ